VLGPLDAEQTAAAAAALRLDERRHPQHEDETKRD
jgi:hypothetical protein